MCTIIQLPDSIMRYYVPGHQITENYANGIKAVGESRLEDSIDILLAEHAESPCRGLALGNAGMSLLRLDQFEMAEPHLIAASTEFEQRGCPQPASWIQFKRNHAEAIRHSRPQESLLLFEQTIELSEILSNRYGDFRRDIEFEAAHALNSWGGSLLEAGDAGGAIERFQRARDIYRDQNDPEKIGEAEVLTNLALAFREIGENAKASLALSEALDVAQSQSDSEQVWKVKIAMIQLDPSLLDADPYSIFKDAAKDALAEGRYSSAYVKHCIRATFASKRGELDHAIEACQDARSIEGRLDRGDASPVKMRLTLAHILEKNGESDDKILSALFDGARMWWSLLNADQIFSDVLAKTQDLHDHFRELARKLLEVGRIDESCMVFESGRALGFALEVNRSTLSSVLKLNPFGSTEDIVDCSSLKVFQQSLKQDEVCISFAILPPHTAVYLVRRGGVASLMLPLPDESELRKFVDNIGLIPIRLKENVGLRAIPEPIVEWAIKIFSLIEGGKLVSIAPNSFLHGVPWRALFRSCGASWEQLASITRFGLLLNAPRLLPSSSNCAALGCGSAGSIDLNDEAQEFAHFFGERGDLVQDATSAKIKKALIRNDIVLVSCHGVLKTKFDGKIRKLYLSLNEGDVPAAEAWPDSVSAGLVILSACDSGVYDLAHGDYPVGAAPNLLRLGAQFCLGTRFPVNARFAGDLMREFGMRLSSDDAISKALSASLEAMEDKGADLWRDLACFELIG